MQEFCLFRFCDSNPKEIGFWIFLTNFDTYDIDLDLAKNPEAGNIEIKTHKYRKEIGVKAVSYTHLTLPTIYSV